MKQTRAAGAPWPHEVHPYALRQPPPRRVPAADLPQTRRLRVYTQDPSIGRLDGAVTTLAIPNEPLEPGPAGAWFVVEYVGEGIEPGRPPLDLEAPACLMRDGLDPSTSDPRFACQMCYAVAMEVYARFMRALGRNPGFGPIGGGGRHDGRLRIHPRAFRGANAYYDRSDGVLQFGWERAVAVPGDSPPLGVPLRTQPGAAVYLALSRDIIAHEVSHALLDGLRPNFMRPTHPDVLALHEGFSDLVAIFLHFAQRDTVAAALERTQGDVGDDRLASIGRQFGFELGGQRRPLRTALHQIALDDPVPAKVRYDISKGEHDLGAVLVSAVFDAYRRVFERKTRKLRRVFAPYQGRMPVEAIELLAAEACTLAEQFLNIVIRAIDYCPSHHCTFGEYLRAMITADADLVPDDPWAYREALVSAFRRYDIPVPEVEDLSEPSLLWNRAPDLVVPALRFANLRLSAADGLIGWADDPAALAAAADALARAVCRPGIGAHFGLMVPGARVDPPRLMSLRPLRRVSPDGSVRFGLVAEFVQRRRVAEGWFYGGSTLVVDSDGRLRYVVYKHIDSERRLKKQRAWLAAQDPAIRHAAWAGTSAESTLLLRRIHAGR